jgi:hypothetical protein
MEAWNQIPSATIEEAIISRIRPTAAAPLSFPPGLEYRVVYNTTDFIQQSVDEVIRRVGRCALRPRFFAIPGQV